MSYFSVIAFVIFVLFPLLIPLAVTGVHAIAKWRLKFGTVGKVTGPQSHARQS
jgi:hypothetical protein